MINSLQSQIDFMRGLKEFYKRKLTYEVNNGTLEKPDARRQYDLLCDILESLELIQSKPTGELIDKFAEVKEKNIQTIIYQFHEQTKLIAEKQEKDEIIRKLTKENEQLAKKIARIKSQTKMGVTNGETNQIPKTGNI